MNHPDNQATMQKDNSKYKFNENTQFDRLGRRRSAHTGGGYVGVARTINDIMADLEKGDEKQVALKSLGHSSGETLDKQSLEGSTDYPGTGDSGLTVYKIDSQNGFEVFNYGSDDEVDDVTDVAEDLDFLKVYDPKGASEDIQTSGPGVEVEEVDFLEDSRTYGAPNVVVEVGRSARPGRGKVSVLDTSDHAETVGNLLQHNGYEDVAVRHDQTYANDLVFASEEEMITD
jgi:hypothetical protein